MTPFDPNTPGVLASSTAATVSLQAPLGRFSLRAKTGLEALGAALGATPPSDIGAVARAGALEVVCIGPDEWAVRCPLEDVAAISAACAALMAEVPHSLVEVSSREVTLVLEGPKVETLLSLGLPRDPRSIAVGAARRTVYDGVTVVLWHDTETRWRMEMWTSFTPHVLHLLETGCAELAAETA